MNIVDLEKYFVDKKKLNVISHAYLISNSFYENIESVFNKIINNCFFQNDKSDFENNPDVYILEPEKNVIKKEQIIDLQEQISKTSQVNINKVYIIKECEKMNAAAANCLLKTLEEPGNNIYAFLITSNIDQVMPTIKSRCQILQLEKNDSFDNKIEVYEKTLKLINSIEKDKKKTIVYQNNFYKEIDKQQLKDIMILFEKFYKDCLNYKYNLKLEYFNNDAELVEKINNNNDTQKIIKKMKILNDNISLLKYNLNVNLFIDKLIIELGSI